MAVKYITWPTKANILLIYCYTYLPAPSSNCLGEYDEGEQSLWVVPAIMMHRYIFPLLPNRFYFLIEASSGATRIKRGYKKICQEIFFPRSYECTSISEKTVQGEGLKTTERKEEEEKKSVFSCWNRFLVLMFINNSSRHFTNGGRSKEKKMVHQKLEQRVPCHHVIIRVCVDIQVNFLQWNSITFLFLPKTRQALCCCCTVLCSFALLKVKCGKKTEFARIVAVDCFQNSCLALSDDAF